MKTPSSIRAVRRTPLLLSAAAALYCHAIAAAHAQSPTTWTGGNGAWFDAAKWTNGVPNSPSADVYIDNQPGTDSIVTLTAAPNNPASITVGRLRIDAGDKVDTGATFGSFTVADTAFAGAGELLINGTFAMPGAGRSLQGGTITLNGIGSLVLGAEGQRPDVEVHLNNNGTIEGTARFGVANSSRYRTFNHGTINANIPNMHMDFHNVGNVNTGMLRASNGGQLLIGQGAWDNKDGELEADGAGAIVAFYRGGFFEGGALTAKNGGVLQVGGSFNGSSGGHTFKDVTLSGPMNLVDTMLFSGTLTNNGTINIPDGAELWNANGSPVTIAGTGEIVLNAANDDAPELIDQGDSGLPSVPWTFEQVKVRGRGNVGYRQSGGRIDNVAITNHGTFQADVDGQTLLIDVANLDNRNGGFLRAVGSGNNPLGGILRLAINGPLRNTGGTIEALDKGRIEAAFARIEGGLIRNFGGFIPMNGMTIVNPTGPGTDPAVPLEPEGMKLEGELTLGSAGANQEAGLVGEIKNSGMLRIAASAGNTSYLRLGEWARPSVNLTGGGQVILGTFADGTQGGGSARIFERLDGGPQSQSGFFTRTFTNADNTIRGFGGLGWDPADYGNFMHLINSGTIMADVPDKTLTVRLRSGVNNNTISSANGGRVDLFGGTFEQSTNGVLEARNTSPFTFFGLTAITGGTLRNDNAPSTAVNFDLAGAYLINLKLQGPMIVRDTGNAGMAGTIQNEGTVRLLNSSDNTRTRLSVGTAAINHLTLNGPGELILGDQALGGRSAFVEAGGGTSNPTLTLNQNLRGFGEVGVNSGTDRAMHLVNNAEVKADVNGKYLSLIPLTITNAPGKTMQAMNGGELYMNPDLITNTGATIQSAPGSRVVFDLFVTLAGGFVNTQPGGKAEIWNNMTAKGGALFTNAGTLEFGKNGGSFYGLENGGSSIINSGAIRKVGSSDYSVHSPLAPRPEVPNSTGAIDVLSGILRWRAQAELTNTSLSAAANTDLTFQDAPVTLSGTNSFTGPGGLWMFDMTATFANTTPPTALNATRLNVGNTTFTGPGTVSLSGGLTAHPFVPTTFSGVQLFTGPGSSSRLEKRGALFQFTNGANWMNSGLISLVSEPGRNDGRNFIDGSAETLFTNAQSGVLRADVAAENRLRMPYRNEGTFEAVSGTLHVNAGGTFVGGIVKPAVVGSSVQFRQVPMAFQGTNTVTGLGTMESFGVAITFEEGAKLNVTNGVPGAGFGLHDGTTVNGGEINLSKDFGFHNYTATPMVFSNTRINTAATAIGRIQQTNGITRFVSNARLTNAGRFDVSLSPKVELNTGAVWDNSGTLNVYDNPTFGGDGTGKWNILPSGVAKFYSGASRDIPYALTLEGRLETQGPDFSGIAFTKGGLFKDAAKILTRLSTVVRFTGSDPWIASGNDLEFNGTGTVLFDNTNLIFEATSQNPNPDIDAGATIAFGGTSTVSGPGALKTTQFLFGAGSGVTVNGSTLETTSGNFLSEWNNEGGKLELKQGARFLNGGRFSINKKVGVLQNDPGIKGDEGTLFHNVSGGRLIHDSNSITEFGVDFQNDGVLEFRKGLVKFLKAFRGRGGLAASGGARFQLSLRDVPLDQQPESIELDENASCAIDAASGQTIAAAIRSNGSQLVAAGGLNLVAAGGLNMVAAGGGNIVAAGGMNMVAAGGGNITATGAGSFIEANNLIGTDGSSLIGTDGASLLARINALISSGAIASLRNARLEAGNLISTDGSSLIGTDGASLVAAGGMNAVNRSLVDLSDASSMVAAGGMNVRDASKVISTDGAGFRVPLPSGAGRAVMADSTARVSPAINVSGGSSVEGNGSFEGVGYFESGSVLRPGKSPGVMTWTGDVSVDSSSSIEIEIAGTASGTQYDVLNVSGTLAMDGTVNIRLLNGFASSVQATDTFDIATAQAGIITGLAGNRVAITGTNASFAVQLVNDGKTLRLTDYQLAAPTFSSWAARYGLTGANAAWNADPNNNGIPNLLEYALGLDPTAIGGSRGTTTGIVHVDGQKYLSLSYTKPTGQDTPSDITYTPERATNLVAPNWSSSSVDLVTHSTTPGPGTLETVTVRSTHPIKESAREFLHLQVTLTGP